MAKSIFDAPQFKTEEGAFAYVEAHLWPRGPVCPHCGNCDGARIRKMEGKTTRMGLYKCNECRKPFTVRMKTIFESSHLALHLWLQVIHLMCASKKGISTRQIQRMLRCSMKTAWFLTHRIREAMADGSADNFGAGGGVVEADETFLGVDPDATPSRLPWRNMMKIVALVDRNTGRSTSMVYTGDLNVEGLKPFITSKLSADAHLMTDEARFYGPIGRMFAGHDTVAHGRGEYVRTGGNFPAHTNTIEGYFSIFKRGMRGIYQHCAKRHLHRYLAEFDFRYSNRSALGIEDTERADLLLQGFVGKRLTYGRTGLQTA